MEDIGCIFLFFFYKEKENQVRKTLWKPWIDIKKEINQLKIEFKPHNT